jgi:hypothetical protein
MDNDSGWAAQAITLTASEDDGQQAKLTLPCRWIELAQVWDGQAGSYFLVSGVEAGSLTNTRTAPARRIAIPSTPPSRSAPRPSA